MQISKHRKQSKMKSIYQTSKNWFYSLDGETLEIRTTHYLFGGLFTWETKREINNTIV